MSKQNHSCDITQVSVQKTHDFGAMATAWHMFWGRASVDIECHRSAKVTGAVTAETCRGSALSVHNSCKIHIAPHPEPWQCDHHGVKSSTHTELHHQGQGQRLDFHPGLGFLPALAAMTQTKTLNMTCSGVPKHRNISKVVVGTWTHGCVPKRSVTLAWPVPSCTSLIQWNNNISPGLTPWPVWIICFRKMWSHLLYPT